MPEARPSLAELQARVHAALRGERALDAVAGELGVPSERLVIYRDAVRAHVARTLAKVYPYAAATLGPARWGALADAFFDEVPAAARELNACVAPLSDWLARRASAIIGSVPPWLPALAALEWELFAAWAHEADVPDAPPAAGADHEGARALNPTLSAIEAPFALVWWLVAHPDPRATSPDSPGPEALATPQIALVFRRARTHVVAHHVATDDLRFALKVVAEGVPLEVAAARAGASLADARRAIERAIDIGLVVATAPVVSE